MKTLDCEQGSPEWLAARCGSLGASSIGDLMSKGRSGESAGRKNLRTRLVVERMTGKPLTTFKSAAMEQGNELEDDARRLYAFENSTSVEQVGLVYHPTIEGSHASPDGLVGGHGLTQIKCPEPSQHKATLFGEKIKRPYLLQINWEMAVTGRKWCDFVSYNPDFPAEMQLHVTRFNRDPVLIVEIGQEAKKILREVAEEIKFLSNKYRLDDAA